VDTVKKLN